MQLPSKIKLIINVYKARSVKKGQEQKDVKITPQFGSLGTHFSIAIIDAEKRQVIYGDSLEWSPPTKLMEEVEKLYVSIFKGEMPMMEIIMFHLHSQLGHGH